MSKNFRQYALLVALVFMLVGVVLAAEAPDSTNSTAVTAAVPASPEDPIKMLSNVTNSVIKALQERKPKDVNEAYSLVDKLILPYVDFDEMSLWVAGRKAWGKASDRTKEDFKEAFKVLVVRTYATALNNYTNEKVEFGPQNLNLTKERIQVSSTMVRNRKDNIRLDYRLIKHDNKWFVYDVIIEGVSILQGFQAQFSSDIRQQGLEKVTQQIQKHNREKNA